MILTAGMGDWSLSWNAVQTPLSGKTRTCAWDRAGYGFSDGSNQMQSAANMAEDLYALLTRAHVAPPYIMVAHSAGVYETMLFTDRHRADVVGMVLVDPSLPDMFQRIATVSPLAATLLRADTANRLAAFRRCAADPDHAAAADSNICFHLPAYAGALTGTLAALDHMSARLATKASLYEQFEANARALASGSRSYGNMPLTILTSQKDPLSTLPVEQPARTAALSALWRTGHDELAALSTSGANSLAEGTGHQIQLEKPDAVISAVDQVVDDVQDGERQIAR